MWSTQNKTETLSSSIWCNFGTEEERASGGQKSYFIHLQGLGIDFRTNSSRGEQRGARRTVEDRQAVIKKGLHLRHLSSLASL